MGTLLNNTQTQYHFIISLIARITTLFRRPKVTEGFNEERTLQQAGRGNVVYEISVAAAFNSEIMFRSEIY